MTFKSWLKKFKNENSPVGDIGREILADPDFPVTQNVNKIEDYAYSVGLTDSSPQSEAFKAALSLWISEL